MDDLHDLVRSLSGGKDEVSDAIEFVNREYRDRVCSWLKCRLLDAPPNTLAIAWAGAVEELVRLSRTGRIPDEWFRSSLVRSDTIDYALRECALKVTERPITNDVEALVVVGEVFVQAGFSWSNLSPELRGRIRIRIRQWFGSLSEIERIVWSVFVRGYPGTRSPQELKRCLELESVLLSEDRVRDMLQRSRSTLHDQLQGILVGAEVLR